MDHSDNPKWHQRLKNRARDAFHMAHDEPFYKDWLKEREAEYDRQEAKAKNKDKAQSKEKTVAQSMDGRLLRDSQAPVFSRSPSPEQNKEPSREKDSLRVKPTPPQKPRPQLTPKGPLRSTVDAQVRQQQAAIKAKWAKDKEIARER